MHSGISLFPLPTELQKWNKRDNSISCCSVYPKSTGPSVLTGENQFGPMYLSARSVQMSEGCVGWVLHFIYHIPSFRRYLIPIYSLTNVFLIMIVVNSFPVIFYRYHDQNQSVRKRKINYKHAKRDIQETSLWSLQMIKVLDWWKFIRSGEV